MLPVTHGIKHTLLHIITSCQLLRLQIHPHQYARYRRRSYLAFDSNTSHRQDGDDRERQPSSETYFVNPAFQMPHMPHTRSTSLHHDDADRQRKVSAFMNPAYEPRRKPRDRDSVYDSKRQSLAATSMCFNNPAFEAPHTDTDTHPHFDGSLA